MLSSRWGFGFTRGSLRQPFITLYLMSAPIPDAPPPTWEQLEKGLVAVKTVVHGLVDFIQNHSKKGADPQQVSQSSPGRCTPGKLPFFLIKIPVMSFKWQHFGLASSFHFYYMPFFFSLLSTASTRHICVATWSRREVVLVEPAAPLLTLRKNWRSES